MSKREDKYKFSPKEILQDACADNYETGSSTCIITTLDENSSLLYTANIGDSGYMILRKEGLDII